MEFKNLDTVFESFGKKQIVKIKEKLKSCKIKLTYFIFYKLKFLTIIIQVIRVVSATNARTSSFAIGELRPVEVSGYEAEFVVPDETLQVEH